MLLGIYDMYEELCNNMELHMRNLEIACNKLSSTKYRCPDRFSEKTPCCSILVRATTSRKRPLPVSDH